MAGSSSSVPVPFFGISREEDQNHQMKHQHSSTNTTNTSSLAPAPPPQAKRRNQPAGTPNPDAEVIALSPKTLMTTNRFICEVCKKGFRREQNLQLHRRGHNLPWKLRQKPTNEENRKVYLCPEPTCVYHDPSRALGDLSGIKKHYSRKHGEKKWRCEKCPKTYAVLSDWKTHSKICGTKEYRCHCGTPFSRRDSFMAHKTFCEILAQKSARNPPTSLNTVEGNLYGNNTTINRMISLGSSSSQVGNHIQDQTSHARDIFRLSGGTSLTGGRFNHLLPPSMGSLSSSFRAPQQQAFSSSPFFMQSHQSQFQNTKQQSFHGLMKFPTLDLENNTDNANLFHLRFLSNGGRSTTSNTNYSSNNINGVPSSGLLVTDPLNAENDNAGGALISGDHHHRCQISSASGLLVSDPLNTEIDNAGGALISGDHHHHPQISSASGLLVSDPLNAEIDNAGGALISGDHHHHHQISSASGLLVSDPLNAEIDNAGGALIREDHHHHHQSSSAFPSHFSSSFQNTNVIQNMSATALLQKVAQMGSRTTTTSRNNNNNTGSPLLMRNFVSSSSSNTTSGGGVKNDQISSPSPLVSANFGGLSGEGLIRESNLQDLMNSFAAASGNSSMFRENPFVPYNHDNNKAGSDQEKLSVNVSSGGSDRLTRDFLGQIVGSMSGSTAGGAGQHIRQPQQLGTEMGSSSSMNSEGNNINITPPTTSQSFGGANNNFH